MEKNPSAPVASSPAASPLWETLETDARGEIQGFLQRVLEEEVDALLGRQKSERRRPETVGYRNGHGRPRQLALTSGTITVRRPRVRDLDERFVSRVLPRFQRRTREGGRSCRSSTCTASRRATSSLRCGDCWARPRRSAPAPFSGSRPTGRASTTPEAGASSRTYRWSMSGPMGSTSKLGWRTPRRRSWCSSAPWPMGAR